MPECEKRGEKRVYFLLKNGQKVKNQTVLEGVSGIVALLRCLSENGKYCSGPSEVSARNRGRVSRN